MNEKEDVNINFYDLVFLLEKVSNYIKTFKRSGTNQEYGRDSMKLWEDRIKKIKSKCNYDELIREKHWDIYGHELRYIKDIVVKIYQKHPKITFSKVLELLTKEIGMSTGFLSVKADIYDITFRMIRDGEIKGEINERDMSFTFQGLRNDKS